MVHVPTIKPLDVAAIVGAAERTGRVITVEEHTVIGGLGGAVAETLAEHLPTRVDRIGLQDVYPQSGPNDALLDIYGLSAGRVADQVRATLLRPTAGPQVRPDRRRTAHGPVRAAAPSCVAGAGRVRSRTGGGCVRTVPPPVAGARSPPRSAAEARLDGRGVARAAGRR